MRELENARESGQQPWLLDNITVEQWLEHWLEEILPLSVRWKTRSGYASHLRVHVIPTIGAARLAELRLETLERLYRQLIDDGRSTHVVHGVHRVLRSSLNEAVRRQRLLPIKAAANARVSSLAPRGSVRGKRVHSRRRDSIRFQICYIK